MQLADYRISPRVGFLPTPDPLQHLADAASGLPMTTIDHIEGIAGVMSDLLENTPHAMRAMLEDLPPYDFSGLKDTRVLERLFAVYAYFANAYVFSEPQVPRKHLTAGVALPFSHIAARLDRPPIFSYSAMVLNNWRRLDPHGPMDMDNLEGLLHFRSTVDEGWFSLVHVYVEASSAPALVGIESAFDALLNKDADALEAALKMIAKGLHGAVHALYQMPQSCDPDVFYRLVRPYMFGFNGVVFDSVDEQPKTLTGGSGAQSSALPAIVGALGIQHEKTGLMQHLDTMKLHMPTNHRRFIADVTTDAIREHIVTSGAGPLQDAYNLCIHQLVIFRRAHLNYAQTYVLDKNQDTLGTGGTSYMDWLTQLIDETEAHLI
jgi:indoleamine 2,3-dioxygenase